MQDFHSIPGLSGRIFVSGGVGGGGIGADHRRLRGYAAGGQDPPAKCPRCDSVNTKFCYYNNYNLSQPRHFCKSCRRYWTKGGLLRNVPVGGGCRKSSSASKRSSSKKSSSSSSSESSSPNPNPNPNANPDLVPVPAEPVILNETGSFSSLMAAAASGPADLEFDFSDPPTYRPPVQQLAAEVEVEVEEMRMQGLTAGLIEQGRINGDGMNGLDWPGSVEPGIFDLTSAVDPVAYWNQSHWGDADPSSLFLP